MSSFDVDVEEVDDADDADDEDENAGRMISAFGTSNVCSSINFVMKFGA